MLKAALRIGLLLVIGAVLSGCAQAQVESVKRVCDFSADPRFASLRGNIALSVEERVAPPTLRQIDNNAKPTPEQREALLALDEAAIPCRTQAMALTQKYGSADIVGLNQELSLARTNLLKLLVNGEITFGQYWNNTYQLIAQANQVLGQVQRAQSIADAAQRQAAAAQFSATMQAFQTFNRQPTVTTCNRLGGSISCISR